MKRFLTILLALSVLSVTESMAGKNPKDLPRNIYSGIWDAGHIQGIALDTEHEHIYMSFTTVLVKADLQGNVIGNPIVPVIKISANPRTVRTMSEHIDVNVNPIMRREMNLDQAGDLLLEMMVRTANGRFTCAEALGHRELVMTKLYRSA